MVGIFSRSIYGSPSGVLTPTCVSGRSRTSGFTSTLSQSPGISREGPPMIYHVLPAWMPEQMIETEPLHFEFTKPWPEGQRPLHEPSYIANGEPVVLSLGHYPDRLDEGVYHSWSCLCEDRKSTRL